ncbi:MAG TPA: AraC family transcriptional regulator [Streptosporangiaceae bacterium]
MTGDWVRYWRWAGQPVEAMHAHFERHVYHRHAHETYSFGVTESGAQAFTCRSGARVSGAGMVMAFNPGDPHDGHAARPAGFTYRMVHISPDLVAGLLADRAGRDWAGREQSRPALPLFTQPVIADPVLARAVRRLHRSLTAGAPTLARDEALGTAVAALAAHAARCTPEPEHVTRGDAARVARTVRQVLDDNYTENLALADVAAPTGRSRYTACRAFRTMYGLAPSDYQRLLRVRRASRLIAQGRPIAEAAAEAGFADQPHLNRWFTRYLGITPASYRRALVTR